MGIRTRIRSALSIATQEEVERRYLDQSVSRTDLERRLREIDEGRLRPRRLGF